MKLKKLALLAMTAALVISAVSGCGVPGDDGGSKKKEDGSKVLRVALDEPPTLDPQMANSMPSQTILYHLGAGLVRMENGNITPDGAESYEVSDDGLVYTFHLREDLKWSDGETVTADDYVYGMKRLVDPNTASPYAFAGAIMKNAAKITSGDMSIEELGVKAIDKETVEITLEYPAEYFLSMLSSGSYAPTRQDYVEKYGKDFSSTADKNVYCGPFVVKDWKPNEVLILERNENYWNKTEVKLDQLEINFVTNRDTAFSMYEAGDLDIGTVPLKQVPQYKDDPKTVQFRDGSLDYIKCNLNSTPELANKNFRLALAYAFKSEEYSQLRGKGTYDAATRLILPDVKGAEKSYGEEYPYEAFPKEGDADKAKEYLDLAMNELGMKPGDVDLELLTDDSDGAKEASEIIQEQFQNTLGIKITIKLVPYEQTLELVPKGEYELTISGWTPDYSDPYTYLELWMTECAYNDSGYSNPEYDKLMEEASNTVGDPKARMDKMFEAEKALLDDAPCIPMDVRMSTIMVNDNVKDLGTYFTGYGFNFIHVNIAD